MTTKTCGRPGCGKKLNKNNKRGVCGTGCLSTSAPPSKQVKPGGPQSNVLRQLHAKTESKPNGISPKKILENFRAVATALGKDPDVLLADAAQGWLDGVREAVAALDMGGK